MKITPGIIIKSQRKHPGIIIKFPMKSLGNNQMKVPRDNNDIPNESAQR